MAFKFNPLTGNFDLVGTGGGSTFNPDTILTGVNVSGELAVLIDNNGNVLTGV